MTRLLKTWRTSLIAALALTTCSLALAQSPNNNCAGATIIPTIPGSSSGTTCGNTSDGPVITCTTASNTSPDVWYAFRAVSTGNHTVSLCSTPGTSTSPDSKLHIYPAGNGAAPVCPGVFTCAGGNDDACGRFTSEVTFTGTANTWYLARVFAFSTTTACFAHNITVTGPPPPLPGDSACNAISANCGDTINGSNVGYPTQNPAFCGSSSTGPGVWYKFTATTPCVTVTTCNPPAGRLDTVVRVFTGGACTALTCVGGQDDDPNCPFPASNGFDYSTVGFNATVGATYYVLVQGFGTLTGAYTLSINCALPPANDLACNAQPLALGVPATWNNQCAGAQPGERTPGPGSGGNSCEAQDGWCNFETAVASSLWFSFIAPPSGAVNITTPGTTLDMQLAVYDATDCTNFATYTELAANDDSGVGLSPAINGLACLEEGHRYVVQLDGFGTTRGSGNIQVSDAGGRPLTVSNNGCQTRLVGDLEDVVDYNYLVALPDGGLPPYSCTWSGPDIQYVDDFNGCQAAVLPTSDAVYTVTVTDGRGCETTGTVAVNVVNAACGGQGEKIIVCHSPDGNPDNRHEICISRNAIPAHVCEFGEDSFGPCDIACTATNPPFAEPPPCVSAFLSLRTDNFGAEVGWTFTDLNTGQVLEQVATGTLANATNYSVFLGCVNPTHCYEFEITDSFGDGICCGFGIGTYSVIFDGNVTPSPSGGAYGTSESIIVGCQQAPAPAPAKSLGSGVAEVEVIPLVRGKELVYDLFLNPATDEEQLLVVAYRVDTMDAVVVHDGPVLAGESLSLMIAAGPTDGPGIIVKVDSTSGALDRRLQLTRQFDDATLPTLFAVPDGATVIEFTDKVNANQTEVVDPMVTPVLPGSNLPALRDPSIRRTR